MWIAVVIILAVLVKSKKYYAGIVLLVLSVAIASGSLNAAIAILFFGSIITFIVMSDKK